MQSWDHVASPWAPCCPIDTDVTLLSCHFCHHATPGHEMTTPHINKAAGSCSTTLCPGGTQGAEAQAVLLSADLGGADQGCPLPAWPRCLLSTPGCKVSTRQGQGREHGVSHPPVPGRGVFPSKEEAHRVYVVGQVLCLAVLPWAWKAAVTRLMRSTL